MNIIWLTKLTEKDSFRTTQMMLSDALRKRGNAVYLILARPFTEKKEGNGDIVYFPTMDLRVLSGLIFGLVTFLYLPRLIRNKNIDVILISGDTIWSPFLLLYRIFRIPLILDLRSLPIDTDNAFLKGISLYMIRYVADGVTTISPELADILKKRYHLQDKSIGVWSSGFSKNEFHPSDEAKPKNRFSDRFVVLHHGTYSKDRGIEELIRSMALLDSSLKSKIKLILVGIPKEKFEDLTSLCKELNVAEQIELIPPVDIHEIPAYIQSCDIGVIPLPTDNAIWRVSVPLKTLEYLAMGKPVLATNIPFHHKIFEMAACGVLCDTNRPEDLAEGILFLYQHKESLLDMGKKGKEIVERYYSWESKACELEEFLKKNCIGN